jgi:hypothetical protein
MNDRLFPARLIHALSEAVFRQARILIVRRARVPLIGHFSPKTEQASDVQAPFPSVIFPSQSDMLPPRRGRTHGALVSQLSLAG